MKLTIAILFCVILTLQYDGADGELKNLFGRIQGSVNKVKQDVNNLFNPNEKKQQEQESTNIHFVEEESEEVDFAAAAAAPKPVEPTRAPTPITSTLAPTSNTAETTTEKDGRENFSGGCVAGYMRTPDGRCKPTF